MSFLGLECTWHNLMATDPQPNVVCQFSSKKELWTGHESEDRVIPISLTRGIKINHLRGQKKDTGDQKRTRKLSLSCFRNVTQFLKVTSCHTLLYYADLAQGNFPRCTKHILIYLSLCLPQPSVRGLSQTDSHNLF